MKKILSIILTVFCVLALACKSKPPVVETPAPGLENPNVGPKLTVVIPELFSPDPDVVNDVMTIGITVNHPVPIKDWAIQIQPNRQSTAQASQQSGEAVRQPRNRGPFFEQNGTGTPAKDWKWNGKSSRESGEMVQSAMEYKFTLTVTDTFGNSSVYGNSPEEGIINVGIIVRRDGDVLRMAVPSIIFPPNAADFKLLNEDDMRSNRRVLNLIGRALNKFPDYKITIEGHSNPTTPVGAQRNKEEINDLKPLSQKRAQAVLDYLSAGDFQYKIDKTRLHAVGMGGTRTIAEYNNSDENWKNRRVEFILRK